MSGETPALVLVDCRCRHPRCDEHDAYRMRGRCTNCGNDTLVGLFTVRHEAVQGVLGRGTCPTCGNNSCRWDRLATPDEVPALDAKTAPRRRNGGTQRGLTPRTNHNRTEKGTTSMTHPRHTPRHSRRRPPVFDGDFDDGQAVTVILRAAPEPPAWDGGPWEGASAPAMLPSSIVMLPAPPPPPEPEPAPRGPDTAFFDRTPAGWVLVCGLCPRDDPARPPMAYFDPSAGDAWNLFGTIRAAAYAAGWSVDLYGQWACGRCQATSRFRTARHADVRHPGAHRARAAGDYDAEFRLRVFAEHDMVRRTAGTTGPGAAS